MSINVHVITAGMTTVTIILTVVAWYPVKPGHSPAFSTNVALAGE